MGASLASTTSKGDRRKSQRLAVRNPPPLTAMSGGKVYTCYVEDISVDGVRLRFDGHTPKGAVIALDHDMAGTLCGSCTWRDDDDKTIGVELQLPQGDLERVLRFICLVL